MKTSNADKWFSMFIRLRDADENGLAKCCTCGTIKPIKLMDCGHFIKRQHQATRFSEYNCAPQCKRCNAFEQGRNEEFEKYLLNRWGLNRVNMLKSAVHQTYKTSQYKIDYLAALYKQKATELSRAKGIALWILIFGFILFGCAKEPQLYCYDCYNQDSTWHVTFLNSTEAEMQHTINWWANCCQSMKINCKLIEP